MAGVRHQRCLLGHEVRAVEMHMVAEVVDDKEFVVEINVSSYLIYLSLMALIFFSIIGKWKYFNLRPHSIATQELKRNRKLKTRT